MSEIVTDESQSEENNTGENKANKEAVNGEPIEETSGEAQTEETSNEEGAEAAPINEKPVLYNLNISPAVRCVKIVARLINLELELRDLDVFNGEHLSEPFIKINPEHTVPTLVDTNGLIVWDSHTISTYLIDKYSENDSLYPKDLNLRARCNQRLFFNNGTLFPRFRAISRHVFSGGDSFPYDFIQSIHGTYKILEAFLETDPFLVGDQLTVADICTSATTTCLSTVAAIDELRYPHIMAWLGRVREEIPFFDEMNEPHVMEYSEVINIKMESNRSKEQNE